jgi:hypothetical protein
VRNDLLEMLEPLDTGDTQQSQYASASSTIAALGLWRNKQRDEHLDEAHMERLFSSYLHEANRWLHSEHVYARNKLDGSTYTSPQKGSSILEQLSERKWERLYAVRFYRLAIVRVAFAAVLWWYLGQRSSGQSPVPAWLPPLVCGLFFCVHALRLLVYAITPWLLHRVGKVLFKDTAPPAQPAPLEELGKWLKNAAIPSQKSVLYQSAHSGRFGLFHTSTLLLGGGLFFAASLCDLLSGWDAARQVYSSGSFFYMLHLLYFLLGWSYTGPLIVMVVSVITTEFVRWMTVFVPMAITFAFPFFILSTFPSAATSDASALAGAITASLFNATSTTNTSITTNTTTTILLPPLGSSLLNSLAFVVNNFFNPLEGQATPDALTSGGDGLNGARDVFLSVAGWVAAVFILAVTLTSLLVAMFTRAFDAQSDRGADFLIERMRANMMLASLQLNHERFYEAPQGRYWLLNRTHDVSPSVPGRVTTPAYNSNLSLRPYFMCQQPTPVDTGNFFRNKALAKKALSQGVAAHPDSTLAEALSARDAEAPAHSPRVGAARGGGRGVAGLASPGAAAE